MGLHRVPSQFSAGRPSWTGGKAKESLNGTLAHMERLMSDISGMPQPDAPKRPWYKKILPRSGTVIPVVRLQGVISQDLKPGRLNIASVAPLLKKAFAVKKAPAVALIVNSPGGSPVQSRLIAKHVRQLADEHNK